MEKKKAKRRLKNIVVKEVSLVDRPCNLRSFLVLKNNYGQGTPRGMWKTRAQIDQDLEDQFENMSDEEKANVQQRLEAVSEKLDNQIAKEAKQKEEVDNLTRLVLLDQELKKLTPKEARDVVKNTQDYIWDDLNKKLVRKPYRIPASEAMARNKVQTVSATTKHVFDYEKNRWVPNK